MKKKTDIRIKPEILAPAGSLESVKAAVNAGCDAIYIGGSRFGARAYADNPQGEDMLGVIKYCHRYGVRVYMTVNTLLKERELGQELYDYILPYYQAGLDAAIVQDVGVMHFLHRNFPDLELHGSTQMTLTMGESAGVLEPYGVTRIVPARELTMDELVRMRRQTGLELEIFVHGALCYCYSGQCLFSSMLGGRSGNRGRCAQPCRRKYSLEGGKPEYFLCPKEHCSLVHIGELIEAGVDSFKIEGRMKRPEYVALTTAMYRKYRDMYLELGREGYYQYLEKNEKQWQDDLRRLAELYNRQGFTSGYMEGMAGVPLCGKKGKGDMLASDRPNHGGVRIGVVTAVDKHTVTYRLERQVHAQDVVEFRDEYQRPLYEYTLGETKKTGESVRTRYLKGSWLRRGNIVYRTKDAALLQEIREDYLKEDKKIIVEMELQAAEGERTELRISAKKGRQEFCVTVYGEQCQRAEKNPAVEEEVRRILCQTGGTVFLCKKCKISLRSKIFLPVGGLKRLRREGLRELQEKMESTECRKSVTADRYGDSRPEESCHAGSRQKKLTEEKSPETQEEKVISVLYDWQAEMAFDTPGVTDVYLRMEEIGHPRLKELVIAGYKKGIRLYLMLPAIFREAVYRREKERLSDPDSIYHMPELTGYVIRNMESFVFLTHEAGVKARQIIADAGLYISNTEAMNWWGEQEIAGNTLPMELTGEEIKEMLQERERIKDHNKNRYFPEIESIVYGYIPLMISAQCIRRHTKGCAYAGENSRSEVLTFRDEKKRRYHVLNICRYCYNIIYQETPLVLEQEREQLQDMGIRRFRYDLTIEDKQQVKKILEGDMPKGQKGHYYLPME